MTGAAAARATAHSLPPARPLRVQNSNCCLRAGACLQSYTIRQGDTLSDVATSHGTNLAAVEAANPTITNPDQIQVAALA